jgi:GT2 family glycosyltransferase
MSSEFAVSIIIVNYNAGDLLRRCVASVFASDKKVEIIIIDNASDDTSVEHLLLSFPENQGLQVCRNEVNVGFAKACNMGAKMATGKHLLYLNPDTIVEPNAIILLAKTLDQNPSAGMVGGLIVNPDGSEQPGCRRSVPTPWLSLVKILGLSRLKWFRHSLFSDFSNLQTPLPEQAISVEAISGACMMVRRQALLDVGGLDEEYFLHCEDLDWCMRFRQIGWEILFVPNAQLTHYQGTCSRGRPIFVEWHKHKGMMRFYRKFFRQQYSFVLMALVSIAVWSRFTLLACYLTLKQLVAKN